MVQQIIVHAYYILYSVKTYQLLTIISLHRKIFMEKQMFWVSYIDIFTKVQTSAHCNIALYFSDVIMSCTSKHVFSVIRTGT